MVVPALEDLLVAFPSVRLNVDAKEARVAAPLAALVRRHGAERRVLLAAEYEVHRRAARGYPGPWGASRRHLYGFWLLHRLPRGGPYTPDADILQVPETWKGLRIVTPAQDNIPQGSSVWLHLPPDRCRAVNR